MPDNDPARAIELLYALIESSPADARNRLRLLPLLHTAGRANEFVLEAGKFHDLCQPVDADTWARICAMGKELAPESPLFQAPPGKDEQSDVTEWGSEPAAGESSRGQGEEDRRHGERRQRHRRKTDKPPT